MQCKKKQHRNTVAKAIENGPRLFLSMPKLVVVDPRLLRVNNLLGNYSKPVPRRLVMQ